MEINKLSISTCSHPISKHNHHSPLENTSPSKASAQPDVDSVAPRRCARYIDDAASARTLASAACTVTDTRLEKGKTRHGQWRTPLNATALIYICVHLSEIFNFEKSFKILSLGTSAKLLFLCQL